MSADKAPVRTAHETLALIADKLSVERSKTADISAPETPPVAAPQNPPLNPPQVEPFPTAKSPSAEPAAVAMPPPVEPFPTAKPLEPAGESVQPSPVVPAAPEPGDPPPFPGPSNVRAEPVSLSPPPRASAFKDAVTTYFPMTIAVLSLVLSIYQGFLFHESIDVMQRNVARGEYIRTCRDIIETYFLVKQRVGVLMPMADRGNVAGASRVTEINRLDAQAAIAKFGGLGTYLANFQDAGTRARYTELTRSLTGIMDTARTTQLTDIDKLFAPADKLFGQMNDDCVRMSRAMKM